MNDLNENIALANLFGNTKKQKRTIDLITLAKSCEFLVEKYGSRKRVAEILELSPEMIRQFLLPLKMPKEVQRKISNREIDSLDVIMTINSLKDEDKKIKAVNLLTKEKSKEIRDIIRIVKQYNISLEKSIDIIYDLKPKGLHVLMLDLEDEHYNDLLTFSKEFSISPALIIKAVFISWLRNQDKDQVI